MKSRIIFAVLLAVFSLPLLAGCQKPPEPSEVASPGLTMDEGAIAADFSSLDLWMDGALNDLGCYDGRSADLTNEALPDSFDQLMLVQFDSKTKWPDSLPAGFAPDEIMEINKNPGLGVRALHENGITGKGVNLGIIDQNLLLEHREYRENVRYYRNLNEGGNGASMHGAAVTSIAVGETAGVAPGASLYYVSARFPGPGEEAQSIEPYVEALNVMLDRNDMLPEGDRLDVISISRGFNATDDGWDQMKQALDRAEDAGIFVITVSTELTHNMPILGASRVPLSDYDDYNNVRPGLFWEDYFYSDSDRYTQYLFVPMDFRTTASPTGAEDYVSYASGGMSWAVPYFAGVYCLARQVKPDVTPQEFWSAALATSNEVNFKHEGASYRLLHVINPPGIVEALVAK